MAALPASPRGFGQPQPVRWESSPLGLAGCDPAGRIREANPALARLLDQAAAALVGQRLAELFPGLPWPLPGGVTELAWSGRRLLVCPLPPGPGAGVQVAILATDQLPELAAHLTGLAAAVARLEAAQLELETVIQASYDEIFITDGEGRVLQVNAACERFYGLPAHELQGRRVAELEAQGLFTPSITPEVIRTRQRQTVVQETRTGRRLVVTSIPILDAAGNLQRVVSVARDVTELNRLVAQLAETEALSAHYRMELELLNSRLQRDEALPIYASRAMQEILDLVRRVAPVDAAVLITGESGVGKGQLARLLHRWSSRSGGPFQTIDCGALPESLIESELFGYESGAFTGASRQGKAGLMEAADGGTLFLDEIGELPLGLQVKLLRFLQDKTVTRVGGHKPRRVDVRVIAATNRDLRAMVARGQFREDLFWRLNVVPVQIPPLRERPEDVPVLLQYFLTEAVQKYHRPMTLDQEAVTLLCRYPWPGNVRELENLVVRLVVTTPGGRIGPGDLPPEVREQVAPPPPRPAALQVDRLMPLDEARDELERQLLALALREARSTREVAGLLGINQSTVVRKLQRLFPAGLPLAE